MEYSLEDWAELFQTKFADSQPSPRAGRLDGLVVEGFKINTGLEGRYVIDATGTINDQSFIILIVV